jgi:hypothetical protein
MVRKREKGGGQKESWGMEGNVEDWTDKLRTEG